MNYLLLKSIIETTLSHFSCKDCESKVTDKDVWVVHNAESLINLEIRCPKCASIGIVKAEVGLFPMGNKPMGSMSSEKTESFLKDEDILAIRQKLKDAKSIDDFLS